jgi:hypothetical protein
MADRDYEIREKIHAYITGDESAAALAEWLQDATWDIESESSATRKLAHDAGRLMDEWENGDWTEAELRERLGVLNRMYWFETAPKVAFPGAEAALIREDRRSAATDRSLEAASA